MMEARAGKELEREAGSFDSPEATTSGLGAMSAMAGIVIGTIYILNPTFGFVEFLPDNWPIVGNLDEAGASGFVILGLQYLGRRRREKRALGEAARGPRD